MSHIDSENDAERVQVEKEIDTIAHEIDALMDQYEKTGQ